ncbi:hypothetical protein OG884_27735 [Streptosporangium sp. NBC_01755]|nr:MULTISPECIES: hypothetical protein [unclassified Streptosporangium]WSA23230.1 hypothetical protein OIE13_19870 [Streptosporangium sp. NBC_01810]WSC98632.1 hypothetical protein OG884_27735 [Streptosporangium sp. NBC_01755]
MPVLLDGLPHRRRLTSEIAQLSCRPLSVVGQDRVHDLRELGIDVRLRSIHKMDEAFPVTGERIGCLFHPDDARLAKISLDLGEAQTMRAMVAPSPLDARAGRKSALDST